MVVKPQRINLSACHGSLLGSEEIGCCAVAGRRRAGNLAVLLEQRQGFADDTDGGPVDVAEGIGQNV